MIIRGKGRGGGKTILRGREGDLNFKCEILNEFGNFKICPVKAD
jgi:hypothetical protein